MKYITRMDSKNSHLWWVRFHKGTNEKGVSKQVFRAQKAFYDSHYDDGEIGALKAARAWRDEQLRLNPKWGERVAFMGKRLKKVTSASTTGVLGVQNYKKNETVAYMAVWRATIDGVRKPRTKNFTYDEHDPEDKKAQFERACRYRKKMEKEHYTGSR